MWGLPPSVRLFVATELVDGRKGPDSLMTLVRDVLAHDMFEGHLFIFFMRRRDRVRIVYWDRDGIAMDDSIVSTGRPGTAANTAYVNYGWDIDGSLGDRDRVSIGTRAAEPLVLGLDPLLRIHGGGIGIEEIQSDPTCQGPPKSYITSKGRSALAPSPRSLEPGAALRARLENLDLTPEQMQAILVLSREVIERVVWEVVPVLAETLIKEEIQRLTRE